MTLDVERPLKVAKTLNFGRRKLKRDNGNFHRGGEKA